MSSSATVRSLIITHVDQLVNDGNALNNEYAKTTDALKKAKAEYQKACKEAEIAQLTFQKAKQDGQTKPKDLEKVCACV